MYVLGHKLQVNLFSFLHILHMGGQVEQCKGNDNCMKCKKQLVYDCLLIIVSNRELGQIFGGQVRCVDQI